MNDATKLAIGILLVWVAGMAFFVAFHPNGVIMPSGEQAKSPADIIKFAMWKARGGGNGSQQSGG